MYTVADQFFVRLYSNLDSASCKQELNMFQLKTNRQKHLNHPLLPLSILF